MLNMVQSPSQERLAALALILGLQDEPADTVLKLLRMQQYAREHGYQATVEPAGAPRWLGGRGGGPCVSVVIPWTACDDTGAVVAEGERVFTARTFRGLRAVLGY